MSQVKGADSTGVVNNNVTLDGPIDVQSLEIIVLLTIICIIKIIEFVYFIYNAHQKKNKKRILNMVEARSRINLNNV